MFPVNFIVLLPLKRFRACFVVEQVTSVMTAWRAGLQKLILRGRSSACVDDAQ